jgi:hypothetical protein
MKKLPFFKTEEEEAEFWDTHDSLEYSEETDELILGGPKTETLNIRLESQVKAKIEEYARLKNMDVSDMVRAWIYECLEREIRIRFPEARGGEPAGSVGKSAFVSEMIDRIEKDQEDIRRTVDSLIHSAPGTDVEQLVKRGREETGKLLDQDQAAAKKGSPGKKKSRKSPAERTAGV